ncbi:hypothetical protein QYM36_003620 [Artemia franciscana]|uniref:Uncharacterized protein n=1 Tax=Artemia franciscana TaxID=6661 RepID=A0AA88IIC4_ARTSF|nr:hypothetical protein QYM36_003620 [Artemia franciscana]
MGKWLKEEDDKHDNSYSKKMSHPKEENKAEISEEEIFGSSINKTTRHIEQELKIKKKILGWPKIEKTVTKTCGEKNESENTIEKENVTEKEYTVEIEKAEDEESTTENEDTPDNKILQEQIIMFTRETYKNAIKCLVIGIPVSCAGTAVWQLGLLKSLAIGIPVSCAGIATWKLIKKYRELEKDKWLREEHDRHDNLYSKKMSHQKEANKAEISEEEIFESSTNKTPRQMEQELKIKKKILDLEKIEIMVTKTDRENIVREKNMEKEYVAEKERKIQKSKTEKTDKTIDYRKNADKENTLETRIKKEETRKIVKEEQKRGRLLSFFKKHMTKWYESEQLARSLARMKKKKWAKAPKSPEYIHSLHDIHVAEIEEEDGIQAVLDDIGSYNKVHIGCIKRFIKKGLDEDKYNFCDFQEEFLQCFLKSYDPEKELFIYDTFPSHLKERFNAKEMPNDFELYCSAEDINISFTQPQLERFKFFFLIWEETFVKQETIIEKIWEKFEKHEISENTIWEYYCLYSCPLCNSPCFKKSEHKDKHDCFHNPGGIVGHYYLSSHLSRLQMVNTKTIRTQDYQCNWFQKFFPHSKKILSNYTCASAPKEYEFAYGSRKHKFKNFSLAFNGWYSPSKSRSGYYQYLVNKYNSELANRFKVYPYRLEPEEEKCEEKLSEIKKKAFLQIKKAEEEENAEK